MVVEGPRNVVHGDPKTVIQKIHSTVFWTEIRTPVTQDDQQTSLWAIAHCVTAQKETCIVKLMLVAGKASTEVLVSLVSFVGKPLFHKHTFFILGWTVPLERLSFNIFASTIELDQV